MEQVNINTDLIIFKKKPQRATIKFVSCFKTAGLCCTLPPKQCDLDQESDNFTNFKIRLLAVLLKISFFLLKLKFCRFIRTIMNKTTHKNCPL